MNNVSMTEATADQDGLLFSEAAPMEDGTSRKRRSRKRSSVKQDLVLDHLQSGKSITKDEARELYGIANLSATISGIEKLGLNIDHTRRKDQFNAGYVSYRLVSEGDNPAPAEPVPDDVDDAYPDQDEAETEPETDEEVEQEAPSEPAAYDPGPSEIKISAQSAISAAMTIRHSTNPKFVAELRDMLAPTPHMAPGGTTNVSSANVRIGTGSIELLLIGAGESENKPFYKLSPDQMKLISLSLKAFAEMAENR